MTDTWTWVGDESSIYRKNDGVGLYLQLQEIFAWKNDWPSRETRRVYTRRIRGL